MTHQITFSLRRIPFSTILEHTKKNSNIQIPLTLSKYNWIYLSNFYSRPSQNSKSGTATNLLKSVLSTIKEPYILCCEPILGTNYRSITDKNAHLTPDERYSALCEYYRVKFGLTSEIQTRTTLKTEIVGHGDIWSDLERKFMWGLTKY